MTKIKVIMIFALLNITGMHAMNIVKPYDVFLRPYAPNYKTVQIFGWGEYGFDAQGYDGCGDKVNSLRILNKSQNGIAMLNGCDPLTPIGLLRSRLGDDDGIRGHLCVRGDLTGFAATLAARYVFPYNLSLGIYVPICSMKLDRVVWDDLTPCSDVVIRENLTKNFAQNVCELGCLDIGGWHRTGLGDIEIVGEWQGQFEQHKPVLKKVIMDGRLGLGLPTGRERDEDKLFALPFGYDGSWSAMFGAGLDLIWIDLLRGGFDVELTHVSGRRKTRRIKTDFMQTDLLLLQKECSYIDYGLIQQFTLHFGLFRFYSGFSFDVGYRYIKRGNDALTLENSLFSDRVANSAQYLKEQTSHQLMLKATYDVGYHLNEDAPVIPRFGVYARAPFNGKRVALSPSIGFVFSCDF